MGFLDKISAKVTWLREQPDSVKTRYVWFLALLVFAAVMVIWAGIFKKYENSSSGEKGIDLIIEQGDKIKEDITRKIKDSNIEQMLKQTPSVSPANSPLISPSTSPEISPTITPEISPGAIKINDKNIGSQN